MRTEATDLEEIMKEAAVITVDRLGYKFEVMATPDYLIPYNGGELKFNTHAQWKPKYHKQVEDLTTQAAVEKLKELFYSPKVTGQGDSLAVTWTKN